MTQVVFLPGFDGDATLRADFLLALAERHDVRSVSYPARTLGSLAGYRDHAMAELPVDWRPVLVAESFSGLVAARWAAVDPRIRGLVLCGAFARNPVGFAARWGASLPELVKIGPSLFNQAVRMSGDAARVRWSRGLSDAMAALPPGVVSERLRLIADEDVGPVLRSLKVPVVVVQFDGDQVIARAARDHLEAVCHNAQVLRLPGPHFALEVRARACAEAIGRSIHNKFA